MPKDPALKAAALADLLSGMGVREVAAKYGVDKATISRWRKGIPDIVEITERRQEQRSHDFKQMIGDYLAENLTTLSAQAIHFRDPNWLERQSASDVAILHGVLADKSVRIIQAAQRALPPES